LRFRADVVSVTTMYHARSLVRRGWTAITRVKGRVDGASMDVYTPHVPPTAAVHWSVDISARSRAPASVRRVHGLARTGHTSQLDILTDCSAATRHYIWHCMSRLSIMSVLLSVLKSWKIAFC